MAIQNPISGKNGNATWETAKIGNVEQISISKQSVGTDGFRTSSTGGQTTRVAGSGDKTGSFVMSEQPTFDENDIGALVIDYASGENAYTGQAIITSIEESIPINDATRIQWTVNWAQVVTQSTDQ